MGRRRYTDEDRATAVLFLESEGYPEQPGALVRVSERLQIPHQTLSRWAREKNNPAPPELVQEKRKTLVELLQDELHAILREMGTTRQDADYRTLGTVMGIVIDKIQLLGGGPTQRIENSVTIDDTREDILSKLAGVATATGTAGIYTQSDSA